MSFFFRLLTVYWTFLDNYPNKSDIIVLDQYESFGSPNLLHLFFIFFRFMLFYDLVVSQVVRSSTLPLCKNCSGSHLPFRGLKFDLFLSSIYFFCSSEGKTLLLIRKSVKVTKNVIDC